MSDKASVQKNVARIGYAAPRLVMGAAVFATCGMLAIKAGAALQIGPAEQAQNYLDNTFYAPVDPLQNACYQAIRQFQATGKQAVIPVSPAHPGAAGINCVVGPSNPSAGPK